MASRGRVLVADDSAVTRALVRAELEAAGYDVVEAVDGEHALELAADGELTVVLLDVEMPGLDGFATLTRLKAEPATADIPVVFLTGRDDTSDVVEALRLGAQDYVRKPPQPAELLARVSAAAQVTHLRDQLQRRTDELARQSRTDHLTALYNRRHLEEHFDALLSSSRRHRYPLGVLLIDVDHFKKVNDTAGHAAGDQVLVQLSQCLSGVRRTEDVLGRWGGEEFVLLCPFTDLAGLEIVAERLRAAVEAQPRLTSGGALHVTVSIGGAVLTEPGPQRARDTILRRADSNLYAAKSAGRNRWVVTPV